MQADTRHSNILFYLLLAAVALGFFYNTHAIPLFDLDEGAFSEATREMFLRGDFISTYLNGEPRYDKPILIYWLQAASVALFGVNEFAFRLPSMLAATAWVAAVFFFVKTVKDAQTAFYAAIMMATALEISVMGRAATADALLNLWITAAMLSTFLFYRSKRARHLYLAFLFMALGFLTKGPVAVMIPLVVSLLFFALKGDLKSWLKAVFNPAGILIFLLVAMPWYVAQYLKEGDAFIQGFFFKHNVGRFQEGMEGHTGNIVYYIPIILLGVLPYTTVLVSGLMRIRQIISDDLCLFLGLWFGFVLVFFSLSGTKLPHYIVYGFVPLFVLMALHVPHLKARRLLFLPPLLFFMVLFFLPEIIARALPDIKDPFARSALADYREYFTTGYRVFFAAATAVTLYFMFERRLAGIHKLFASGLFTAFALAQFVVPVVAGIQQQPIKEAALIARQRDYAVVMWKMNTPSFNVYSERMVKKRAPRAGDVVLTRAIYLPELARFEMLYQKNGIALVRVLP